MRTIVRPTVAGRLVGLLCALALVALGVPFAPHAWAHASLVDSSPEQGEVLDALPDEVWFEFSQDMDAPAYVVVTAPDGTSVTSGDPAVTGEFVRQALSEGPDGSYSMAYRAVSEDGHPMAGEITFGVGEGVEVADPGEGGAAASGDPADASEQDGSATGDTESDVGGGGTNWVAVAVAGALFGGAVVMYLLSRRAKDDPVA